MKVFTKILGAVLLLGCLAYISFVFGKYVLSSTLLKSIPKSERIINAGNSTPASPSDSSPRRNEFSPQVQMRVMPNTRSTRITSVENNEKGENIIPPAEDPDDGENTRKKLKQFDEGELSSSRRRRSRRRSEETKKADETEKATVEKEAAPEPSKKKPSVSTSAPIRRMNQVEKADDTSPVPKPEKKASPANAANSGDAASISPIPKPE